MKSIQLVGDIDERHRLQADVPAEVPAGPVHLIVLLPDEDEGGIAWPLGVTREWSDELHGLTTGPLYARRRATGECAPVRSS